MHDRKLFAWNSNNYLDYPYDQAGYELGDALYKSNIASFSNGTVCDIIKKHNLKFREDVTYGEDTDFAIRALSHGNSIKISNEITYYYIQHQDSLISTSKLRRFDYVPVLEDLALFFKSQNRSDLAELIYTSRIPRAIFGNMNYFFYNDYDYDEVINKMKELDLFEKLSKFKGDKKFGLKIKLFLLNPKLYYIMWKKSALFSSLLFQ
jgi:hypothetical protein